MNEVANNRGFIRMKRSFRMTLLLCSLFLFCASLAPAPQFRFAWLSDTHVGSPNAAADLEAAVRDINDRQNIAFVLVSGDVTEMGSDAELAEAKNILERLTKPFYIIPGNHDTKWSESGCTTFRRLFKSDRFMFEYGGFRFIGLHEGPIMKMGDGHFAPEDLRWFDATLSSLPDPGQPLIFVTHYPLDPGIDNWFEAIDRLKRFNVQAVLVGHGHQNKVMDFEGVPGVMGRSNLRASTTASGYTIAEVQPESMRLFLRIPGIPEEQEWHRLVLQRHDYARAAGANPRPDFSGNLSYPTVHVRWEVDAGFTIASTPAIWRDRLVVGDAGGTFRCVALKDGKEQWRFKADDSIYATPAIADGRAVFGSTDHNIYCLDMQSGRQLWKVATEAAVVGGATIANGTVYIGGSDRAFRALELRTGKIKWEFKGLNGFVETKPLLVRDQLVFGAWDTCLYALRAGDGSLAWKWTNGSRGILYSPAVCWPVASAGKVFIAAPDRYLTAIDAATGATVWRSNQFAVRETVGISKDGTRVYARATTDNVVALAASGITPEVLWTSNCGYGYDIDPSMPIEKDGVVFFGTKNGLVYALEGRSGAVRWKYRIGVTVVNTPVPVNANEVVITDLDGRIILLASR